QHLAQLTTVFADASDVNTGRETARSSGRADAEGILARGASRVARDTAGNDSARDGQLRCNLKEPRFAHNAARHNFDDMAEAAGLHRLPQRIAWHPILRALSAR